MLCKILAGHSGHPSASLHMSSLCTRLTRRAPGAGPRQLVLRAGVPGLAGGTSRRACQDLAAGRGVSRHSLVRLSSVRHGSAGRLSSAPQLCSAGCWAQRWHCRGGNPGQAQTSDRTCCNFGGPEQVPPKRSCFCGRRRVTHSWLDPVLGPCPGPVDPVTSASFKSTARHVARLAS